MIDQRTSLATTKRTTPGWVAWFLRLGILAWAIIILNVATGWAANPIRDEESAVAAADETIVPQAVAAPAAPADQTVDLKLPPGRPTKVEVNIEIAEVSQIQDHDQKFELEFTAYFVWRDPRLAFDGRATGETKRIMAAEAVWTPDPLLLDELDVDTRGGEMIHVHPDGTVYLNRYYRGTVAGNFDLHEFPLDRHDLEVDLEATNYEVDEVEFVAGEVKAAKPDHAVPHGWRMEGMWAESRTSTYARINETYSLLKLTIQVTRDPHFYFWSIVLPLIPIVATAWSVFWMDPKEFSSQVGVGMTAMLTVVAYRITIDSSLPPLTYMTRMDYFLLICQTFVFIAFVAVVAIHVLYAFDTPHMRAKAAWLTELCRWLPPVVLSIISVLLAVLPVRYGTYVILTPVVLLAVWFRPALWRLPRAIRTIVRPELLLEAQSPTAGEPPTPSFMRFSRKKNKTAAPTDRRSA